MATYKIVRLYHDINKRGRAIKSGLTLQEAQAHCNDPSTRGDGWFDGYQQEHIRRKSKEYGRISL